MMKALSLFTLVFTLALHPVFAQDLATTGPSGNGDEKNKKAEAKTEVKNEEPAISAAEQADRDLLIPRKYQEQMAAKAEQPIKYGPPPGAKKTTYARKGTARRPVAKGRKTTTYRKPATRTAAKPAPRPAAKKPAPRK